MHFPAGHSSENVGPNFPLSIGRFAERAPICANSTLAYLHAIQHQHTSISPCNSASRQLAKPAANIGMIADIRMGNLRPQDAVAVLCFILDAQKMGSIGTHAERPSSHEMIGQENGDTCRRMFLRDGSGGGFR